MDALKSSKSSSTREAMDALIAYFRSYGFDDPTRLSRLAVQILDASGARTADEAREAADARVEAWLRGVFPGDRLSPQALVALGRAAFLLAMSARRWPDEFLSGSPSEAHAEALLSAAPIHAPVARASGMPTQSLVPHRALTVARRLLMPEVDGPGARSEPS